MKSFSLKKQKGFNLLVAAVGLAIISLFVAIELDSFQVRENKRQIKDFHQRTYLYIKALKFYRKVNCTAVGAVDVNDLYPAYAGEPWDRLFGSIAEFQISITNRVITYSVTVTFTDQHTAGKVKRRFINNMLIEDGANDREVIFSHAEQLNSATSRNSYNRSRILSSNPSGC